MRWSVLLVFSVTNILTVRCSLRKDADYWNRLANDELNEALGVKLNTGIAKNIILFIGDGMGPNTVTATRIYKGGESHRLSYEKFPHVGLLKTYSADKMVPDSSCTATALMCGVKTNQNTVGVDATVFRNDCNASLKDSARLESIAALALKTGRSAGLVTTMQVTHATPAPVYAHSASRSWECDASIPPEAHACKDIARQMVEDWPGRDLQVIMGGGRQSLVYNVTSTPSDPVSSWGCSRRDGRNLIDAYRKDKEERGLRYKVASNYGELSDINIDETDYLLGIFANHHLKYEHEKAMDSGGMPSIVNMTEAAIKVLQKNPNGFFLMVEGGNIDMAHHRGRARSAINEAAFLDDAVAAALRLVDPTQTLVVVTADHTHTLSINGYPERGADIFGVTGPSRYDNLNYTTLSYGTGGPGSMQYTVNTDESGAHVVRREPSTEDTRDFMYEQIAGIPLDENSHGGGDVVVYAKGPFSHLFHNVHEQHYVYHALAYAARGGSRSNGESARPGATILFTILFIFYVRN